jgi:hypothetical protein
MRFEELSGEERGLVRPKIVSLNKQSSPMSYSNSGNMCINFDLSYNECFPNEKIN